MEHLYSEIMRSPNPACRHFVCLELWSIRTSSVVMYSPCVDNRASISLKNADTGRVFIVFSHTLVKALFEETMHSLTTQVISRSVNERCILYLSRLKHKHRVFGIFIVKPLQPPVEQVLRASHKPSVTAVTRVEGLDIPAIDHNDHFHNDKVYRNRFRATFLANSLLKSADSPTVLILGKSV